jgi:ribose transport system ATP-binding protein
VTSDGAPLLALDRVRKSFEGTCVLDAEGIEIRAGHVYGLMGANGSGKSTLVGVISGYHSPDPGSAGRLHGEQIRWPLRGHAARGIAVVPQDKGLCAELSVVDNMLVTRRRSSALLGTIDWKKERRQTQASLAAVGLSVDPGRLVSGLSPAEQALVSLARAFEEVRAVGAEGSLVILDEPTTNLNIADVNRVLDAVAAFARQGAAVIIVNHRLAEIRYACESVIVLRNGRVTENGNLADLDEQRLLVAMFDAPKTAEVSAAGREERARSHQRGEPLMALRRARAAGDQDMKIEAYGGEVLGVTGLVGMGQDLLPYQVVGALPRHGLDVRVCGRKLAPKPIEARRAGIICVPADRRAHAFWMAGTVYENYSIARISRYSQGGHLNRKQERGDASAMLASWNVVARSTDSLMATLSGGNQQKISLARAVAASEWNVLLVHEPTQGIDVATRAEVLRRLRSLATPDRCVVIFGADYDALAAICDRIVVLRPGGATVELTGEELTEESVAYAAMSSAGSSDRPGGAE